MTMIKKIIAILMLVACVLPAAAVTEKEMEEAKAITAQAYLRYANDGSGYLDDFRATSMSELESKLKTKEVENLKAFKTVKVPGDYASWTKDKLVEFWSVTFFASPNLAEKGKGARTRVKQRISAMNVGAPAPAEAPKPEAAATPTADEVTAALAAEDAAAAAADNAPEKNPEEIHEEILADQQAIAEDAEQHEYKSEDSGTWIYVLVLVVLIGVVIWLVVFAANMMKRQSDQIPSDEKVAGGDGSARKENENLRKQYASVSKGLEEYKTAFEESQAENKRLRDENKRLREEIAGLKAAAAERPRAAAARQPQESPARSNVMYLGRVNNRGLFVRADRKYTPGSSFYRLESRDGLVGTFHLVDAPEVTERALANPVEYLSGGCTAIDIEDTADAQIIVTENAGTALFEDGAWKVLRKSRIRFE